MGKGCRSAEYGVRLERQLSFLANPRSSLGVSHLRVTLGEGFVQDFAASMPATVGSLPPLDPASLLPGNCPMQSYPLTPIPDLWQSGRINIRIDTP